MIEEDPRLVELMVRVVNTEMATTILLAGELDGGHAAQLNHCVEEVLGIAGSGIRVRLDAIALHSIDLEGARALIQACDRLDERCELEVSWLQPQVRELLAVADSHLHMDPGRTEEVGG